MSSKLAWWIGLVCIAVALLPGYRWSGDGPVEDSRMTVGLPFSPLYVYEKHVERFEGGATSTTTTKTRVEVLSVSTALLVAGVLLISIARAVSKEKRVLGARTGASS